MNVAVVGCGVIARTHVKVAKQCGANIVALCDIDLAKAQNLATQNELDCALYTDYKQMLKHEQVDVLHICTPHFLHCEMTVYALKRDINVLCEKPLCISCEQMDEVLQAEKTSKAQLGVCLQNRYNLATLAAKQYLDGKTVAEAHGEVCWNRGEDYYRSGDWRGKWATEGGGVLINQALHTMDLLQYLCGMPDRVTAQCGNWYHKGVIEVEDVAAATFFGDGGGNFDFFATTTSAAELPAQLTIKTSDKHTVVVLPDTAYVDGQTLTFDPHGEYLGKCCYGKGHASLIPDFYGAVEKGEHFAIDGNEAAKVVKMILAVYKSKGQEQKI